MHVKDIPHEEIISWAHFCLKPLVCLVLYGFNCSLISGQWGLQIMVMKRSGLLCRLPFHPRTDCLTSWDFLLISFRVSLSPPLAAGGHLGTFHPLIDITSQDLLVLSVVVQSLTLNNQRHSWNRQPPKSRYFHAGFVGLDGKHRTLLLFPDFPIRIQVVYGQ